MDKDTLQAVKDLLFEMRAEARKESVKAAAENSSLYLYHRGQYHALGDAWHTIDYLSKAEK